VLQRPIEFIAFESRIFFTVTDEEILMKQSKYSDAQIMHCPAGDWNNRREGAY